ncbi:MAG TPA: response regulator transcription factor [Trueperaceae bacterium]|nr:response regulator transcription factor [Trueperaceae bacterium]
MKTILVIEDDRDIADLVELYLRNDGYKTERASDGARAIELWRAARPDLVVLDIGLPSIDGLDVLRHIRKESNVPVIMLTARTEEIDELLGLGLGADDYVTKPFSPRTLLARIKAVLRRGAESPASQPIRFGPLTVDDYAVSVSYDGTAVHLTRTEFNILHHLAETPGRAVSRAELSESAMPESDALERAIDVHVKNLRQKLADVGGEGVIETVRGVGYRLVDLA